MSRNSTLNVFGDSYSTPDFCVQPRESFWGLAAKDLKVSKIVNYSHPGFSFDAVLHILLNETFNFTDDYFLIGVPPLHRYIAYSDRLGSEWSATEFDSNYNSTLKIPVNSLDNTTPLSFKEQFTNDREEIDRFSREWLDVQSLEKIFLLHQHLTAMKSRFLILNLSVPISYQDLWPAGKSIMTKVNDLNECVIFDHTYQSVNINDQISPADFSKYGWAGHHGAAGNLNWYNKIVKPKMIELKWSVNNA